MMSFENLDLYEEIKTAKMVNMYININDFNFLNIIYFLKQKSKQITCNKHRSRKKESKVAQSCPTLCDSMDIAWQALCPWNCPGKNTGVGCHFLLQLEVKWMAII